MSILEQINRTVAELAHVKPRSRRRIELETRLRDLRLKQIKQEIREGRNGSH